MEKTQKLTSHKEEGDELASGLLVVPAPALGGSRRGWEVSPGGEQCHDPPLPEDIVTHSFLCTHSFIPSFSRYFGGVYFMPGSVLGPGDTAEKKMDMSLL